MNGRARKCVSGGSSRSQPARLADLAMPAHPWPLGIEETGFRDACSAVERQGRQKHGGTEGRDSIRENWEMETESGAQGDEITSPGSPNSLS